MQRRCVTWLMLTVARGLSSSNTSAGSGHERWNAALMNWSPAWLHAVVLAGSTSSSILLSAKRAAVGASMCEAWPSNMNSE